MIPISDPYIRRRSFPYVTLGLVLLNLIVFIYELSLSELQRELFFYRFGLIPAELTSGQEFTRLITNRGIRDISPPIIDLGVFSFRLTAWWTVFTSMFIHGNFAHFIGNMVFLWVFGDNTEDRIGHLKYLVLYLAWGVAAAWTQVAVDMDSEIPNIGASGAIAGVLGTYFMMFPYSRINTLVIFFFILMVQIPAIYLLGFWFLLQFFGGIGSLGPAAQNAGGVAYFAHVGGFVAGALPILVWRVLRGRPILPPRYGRIR